MAETAAEILAAHRSGTSPEQTLARTYARIREHGDPAIFVALRDENDALAEAGALAARGDTALPLYGVPFAVEDNIDVAGLPTTAACPAFACTPKAGRDPRGAAARRRRDPGRQDQSRPVRIRLGARERRDAHAGSSIRLTCAATTCQPSANRTQVCICRPTLPGTVSRRNSVEATAKSRP